MSVIGGGEREGELSALAKRFVLFPEKSYIKSAPSTIRRQAHKKFGRVRDNLLHENLLFVILLAERSWKAAIKPFSQKHPL